MTYLPAMKVLFWFRKSEAKSQIEINDPLGSIQCRITIDGVDLEMGSTKVSCRKSQWNAADQTVTGTSQLYRKQNKKLHEISTALGRVFDILSTKYDFVTPQLVKDYFYERKKFIYSMTEISDAFLAHRAKLVGQKTITKSTYGVNENYAAHILIYCTRSRIIRPAQLPNTFFTDLYDFLLTDKRCGARMGRKVASFTKQMLKWACSKKMCVRPACFDEPMPGVAESEDFIDTTHLSISEVEKLFTFDFMQLVKDGKIMEQTANTLSLERDAFIFNCFTGMHHVDYTKKEFRIEPYKGSLFLRGKREKTGKPFSVKLLEPAVDILQRYGGELATLPVKSNQKRNDSLKIIAFYVGLRVKLTTKIARKTFCDLALNEMMMPADDVSACLGLTSTKYLKNYGRIREKRLLKSMKSWHELKQAS